MFRREIQWNVLFKKLITVYSKLSISSEIITILIYSNLNDLKKIV